MLLPLQYLPPGNQREVLEERAILNVCDSVETLFFEEKQKSVGLMVRLPYSVVTNKYHF